jgi:hypothetical protein
LKCKENLEFCDFQLIDVRTLRTPSGPAGGEKGRSDWMKRNGENATGYQENGEVLRRSALRIDARKWLSGKMAPKKYGDKQTHEHAGPDGGPITLEALIMASLKKE